MNSPKAMATPEPLEVTPLEAERGMLADMPDPPLVPACDPLAPRFPELVFFMRLLAARYPGMADVAAELLSMYAMGWHCRDPPRDSTIDYVEYAAEALRGDEDNVDRLYEFESRFTLFFSKHPTLQDKYRRPSLRPGTVVLSV